MNVLVRKILVIIISITCCYSVCCLNGKKRYSKRIFALDTVVEITLYGKKSLLDSLSYIIESLDTFLSISNPRSVVYKINHSSDSYVPIDPAIAELFRFCLAEYDSSGGLFDITVGRLKYLYGIESHQKEQRVPSELEIEEVLNTIGRNCFDLIDDSTVYLSDNTIIDLGGIAKGYILSECVAFLKRNGCTSYLINLGGDIAAGTIKPDGSPWNIGVRHPRIEDSIIGVIKTEQSYVFTSGDYERFFIRNGIRYHHLFNPKTAKPATHNQSVTLVAKDALIADAVIKASFCMKAKEAIAYSNRRGCSAVVVDSCGNIYASGELKGIFIPESAYTVQWY